MAELRGTCHCGNIRVVFEPSCALEALPVRECACTFCRRHAARMTSDAQGRVAIAMGMPEEVSRYRFGLATADFLVCRRCGVFMAAFFEEEGRGFATINVNALDERARFTQESRSMDYDGEDVAARLARRRQVWTPATLTGPAGC